MHLEMKPRCQKCQASLPADGEAYICSFECTFCPRCASSQKQVCPHCGGDLVPRPRRSVSVATPEDSTRSETASAPVAIHTPLLWAISFGVWTFVSLAATASVYAMYRISSQNVRLGTIAGMEFGQILSYAPLTPFAYALAMRYPFRRSNWARRTLLYLAAGFVFTSCHTLLAAATPYDTWDPVNREWSSAFWNPHTHSFRDPRAALKRSFLYNVVDDFSGEFVPIVLIGHAVAYYRRLRERELRTTQLEGQLAKARLQTLKSQLQPHFLFNTLHSISALMLTDVVAADRMMTALSDLLRMNLESNGTQLTTLSREMEFLNVYLDIEKARFEERLQVVFDIAPECLDAHVPHLLLQPLVENAVRHGVSKRSSPGEIRVAARREGSGLQLWIRDNGPGLASPADEKSSHGLGLRLTRERLQTLYGVEQSCDIRNLPEGGAEVSVRIPFRAVAHPEVEGDDPRLMSWGLERV